jgi:hypothetical protein
MGQESERVDRLDKIVQFSEALRFRRPSANASQPLPEPARGPEDDEPPPDGAACNAIYHSAPDSRSGIAPAECL